jgi:hypothetical protein
MGLWKEEVFDILRDCLKGGVASLETYTNGSSAALAALDSEVSRDPAVQMLLFLTKGLLEAVVRLAEEVDDLRADPPS